LVRLGIVLLAVGTSTAVAAAPAHAAAGNLSCSYVLVSQWSGGFQADFTITNAGPAVTGWTTRWTFPTPTTILSAWGSVIAKETATELTLTNASFNGTIATNQTLRFGWTAMASSTGIPSDINVNGAPC
jgi:cellulase/cellobiase CelA1